MKRRDFFRGTVAASAGLFLSANKIMAENPGRKKNSAHKILSCNIRVALPEDEEKGLGWSTRKELCAKIIRAQKPDIICLQEVLNVQVEDMRRFFTEFVSFGFEGPDMDRYPEGYHGIAKNVILFSKKRYELVSQGCYWLSETPHLAGTMSWGTARARHANWLRLKERASGKEFRVVNIHLDHISQSAREAQMKMIAEEAAQYPGDFPQLLAGDFNTGAANRVLEMTREAGWNDSYTTVHGNADPGFTYHAFKGPEYTGKTQGDQENSRIDFILMRGKLSTSGAQIIRDSEKGRFPSDHYFVSAEIRME